MGTISAAGAAGASSSLRVESVSWRLSVPYNSLDLMTAVHVLILVFGLHKAFFQNSSSFPCCHAVTLFFSDIPFWVVVTVDCTPQVCCCWYSFDLGSTSECYWGLVSEAQVFAFGVV